jgi:DNA-binding transcriptional LysR family regulator
MLFRQLEYFVALARERHFARAAKSCYVSQPALSEAIRKLEHELGVPLVLRGAHFEGLTPEGQRLVHWARRILADRQAMENEVTGLRTGLTGDLRLGVVPGAATRVTLAADAFCTEHPLVRLRMTTGLRSAEIIERIRRFELEAGIVYTDGIDTDGLAVRRLYDERQVLIGGPDLLSGARHTPEPVSWAEAVTMPLCLLPPGMRGRDRIDEAAGAHGLTVQPRLEADSLATLLALVDTGRWASIVPRSWLLGPDLLPNARIREMQPPAPGAPVALVLPASDPVPVLSDAFGTIAVAILRTEPSHPSR